MRTFRTCLVLSFLTLPAFCQGPLSSEVASIVDGAMNSGVSGGELSCHTRTVPPFLDFALRFEVGFVISCGLAQFEGKPAPLAVYVRVVPSGGTRAVFGERLTLPAISEKRKPQIQWNHFRDEVEFSGAVVLGEGRYQLEVLLVDDRNRSHRKKWNVKVAARGKEKSLEPTIRPNTASAISVPPWQHSARATESGRKLTVFLDAAPIVPSALKLRAWDRAFLLGSLATLLRQTSAGQVRVVAFSLDQQREIFRDDNFDRDSFRELTSALRSLELGTVSYKTLQRTNGWADLLVSLLNREVVESRASDAVVFLGPNSRILDKIAPESIRARADIGPRLYYFEYFFRIGYEFPDTIHHLISACHGTIFKVHSPADFAASVAKLQRRLVGEDANP